MCLSSSGDGTPGSARDSFQYMNQIGFLKNFTDEKLKLEIDNDYISKYEILKKKPVPPHKS